LCEAAAESRATYGLTWVPTDLASMERYIEEALSDADKGRAVPFATVDAAANRVVGSTRFGNIERWVWTTPRVVEPAPLGPDAVEIGWTWLSASAQRTHINSEAKLLMLTHAFEVWRCYRVLLKTDARNARSRAAIERIGGKLDGLFRGQMPAYDGTVRTSAVYTILSEEWPGVRARLEEKLR
jgi:RimJ/RimL family protein N-acetyltransferase